MARVLTNNTALAFARQTSRGVLGGSPVWESLEPNSIGKFGPEIATTPRNPISKNRQRRKGTITDLDSAFDYEADLTIDLITKFMPNFLMSSPTNADLTFRGAPATSGGYTIPAATAAQGAKIRYTAAGPITLVYARGYAITGNNGLKPVSADTATSGVLIAVAGNAAETPPTNAEVSVAGIRAESGDLAVAVSGGIATLTSGHGSSVTPIDFTTLGLTVGQRMHVGGLTTTNRFYGVGPVVSYGSGRIRTIAAGTVTLDKIDATLIASDGTADGAGGAEKVVDLLYGRFYRNVAVDHASFLEQYLQVEAEYPNLYETDPVSGVAQPNGYEYSLDNLANQLELNMPGQDKATATIGFIGTDTPAIVDGASRKTNASTPIAPLFTEAINTSAAFLRLRIADVDDTGLTSDFKDVKVTINNNVSPEKVLGLLGARYMNTGNFEIDVEATALFTNAQIPARIRANTTVSMDWLLSNADGAAHFDIPSMTMGSDGKDFPENESVKIALKCEAFGDSFFGSSLGVSLFPVYPG